MSVKVLTICYPVTIRVILPDDATTLPDDLMRCAQARRSEIITALEVQTVKRRRPYVGSPHFTLKPQARYVVRPDARQQKP